MTCNKSLIFNYICICSTCVLCTVGIFDYRISFYCFCVFTYTDTERNSTLVISICLSLRFSSHGFERYASISPILPPAQQACNVAWPPFKLWCTYMVNGKYLIKYNRFGSGTKCLHWTETSKYISITGVYCQEWVTLSIIKEIQKTWTKNK